MIRPDLFIKISFFCFPDEILSPTLRQYALGVFEPSRTRPTIGIDVPTKHIKLDDSNIKLILTDISTTSHFASQHLSYLSGSSAAIFAFSKTDHAFFESAVNLYQEFRHRIPDFRVPVVFIGLHGDSEVVTWVEGQSLTQELSVNYFEMVATDLQALDSVLKSLSRKVIALKTI